MAEEKKDDKYLKLHFDMNVRKEVKRLQSGVQQCYEDVCRVRDSKNFPIKSQGHVSNAASVFQESLAEKLQKFVTPESRQKLQQQQQQQQQDEESLVEETSEYPMHPERKSTLSVQEDEKFLRKLSEKFPGKTLHPDIRAFLTGSELTMPEKEFLLDFLPPINNEYQSLAEQNKFLQCLQEKMTQMKLVDVSIVDLVAEFYKTLLKQCDTVNDCQETPKEETELDKQKIMVDNFIKGEVTEAMRINFVSNLQRSAEKFAKKLFSDVKKNPKFKNYFSVHEILEEKFNEVLIRLSEAKNKKQKETASADEIASKTLDYIAAIPIEYGQAILEDLQKQAEERRGALDILTLQLEQAKGQLKKIKNCLMAGKMPEAADMTFFPFANHYKWLIEKETELLRSGEKYFYLMEFVNRPIHAISLDEALAFYAKDKDDLAKYHENPEVGSYPPAMSRTLVKMAPWLRGKVYFQNGFIQVGSGGITPENSQPSVWSGSSNFHKPASLSSSPKSSLSPSPPVSPSSSLSFEI
ncbi:MAG TPA: hypothetical protein VHE99_03135 [Gammaproteobacteria bacterium]|nr:hypothetical protein [Gammaproteobacteria bacterium]